MRDVNPLRTLTRRLSRVSDTPPLASAEAFSALYVRAHVAVFRYLYGMCGGPRAEAEDLTAETFAKAWKARDRFQGDEAAALGWLFTIARRLAIDRYRRAAGRDTPDDLDEHDPPSPDVLPEDAALLHEQRRTLWRLMQSLPPEPREMLVLRYVLGWRVGEIASRFRMAENSVSVALRRALARLQRSWPGSE